MIRPSKPIILGDHKFDICSSPMLRTTGWFDGSWQPMDKNVLTLDQIVETMEYVWRDLDDR